MTVRPQKHLKGLKEELCMLEQLLHFFSKPGEQRTTFSHFQETVIFVRLTLLSRPSGGLLGIMQWEGPDPHLCSLLHWHLLTCSSSHLIFVYLHSSSRLVSTAVTSVIYLKWHRPKQHGIICVLVKTGLKCSQMLYSGIHTPSIVGTYWRSLLFCSFYLS